LVFAFETDLCGGEGIERRFDVRHVDDGGVPAGKAHREAVAADHAVLLTAVANARGHLVSVGLVLLVKILDDDHLRAVDHAFSRLAAFQARLPDDGRIAGGVHEAAGSHPNVAITRGEFQRVDPASLQMNMAQDRA
jgi:hypothetical protein